MNLIAEGTNISEVNSYAPQFENGSTGELRLYFDRSLTEGEIASLRQSLGTPETQITDIQHDSGVVSVKFQRVVQSVGQILLIGTILIGGFLAWQLLKGTVDFMEQLGKLAPYILGGLALWLLLGRKKQEPVRQRRR